MVDACLRKGVYVLCSSRCLSFSFWLYSQLLGHWGELGGPSTSRLEQPHKRDRRHTHTKNLNRFIGPLTNKVFNLYFSIGCETYITHTCTQYYFSIGCGTYITHICTQHTPSSVSPFIHHAPPSSGSSYLLVSPLLVSPQTDRHCLYRRCCFLCNGPEPHKRERRHTLTQNLKAIGLWVLLHIRCSTFTFLSDVGHI